MMAQGARPRRSDRRVGQKVPGGRRGVGAEAAPGAGAEELPRAASQGAPKNRWQGRLEDPAQGFFRRTGVRARSTLEHGIRPMVEVRARNNQQSVYQVFCCKAARRGTKPLRAACENALNRLARTSFSRNNRAPDRGTIAPQKPHSARIRSPRPWTRSTAATGRPRPPQQAIKQPCGPTRRHAPSAAFAAITPV